MDKFTYRARSLEGALIKGIVEAANEKHAATLLRERGMVLTSLKKQGASSIKLLNRVGMGDLVNFTRQLATMINSGLTLVDSLNVLEGQSEGKLKQIVGEVRRSVESGQSLSKSMAAHGDVFDTVYISLIEAGEAAGVLDKVMDRLAENMEKKREFSSKVKGALLYPILILFGMLVVVVVLLVFVIPQLKDLYNDFGADLPWMTKLLITMSNFVINYWPILILMVVGLVFGSKTLMKNREFRRKAEVVWLASPVFGSLWEQVVMANLTRTLSMLVEAGVPIVEGLELTSRGTGSAIFEEGVANSARLVEKGFPMAQAFAQQDHFPTIVPQMLSVGEETGQVHELLKRVSIYFQTESEQRVKNLTTALEPMILALLGGGVGFLVFAIVMPIYQLTDTL